MSNLESPTRGTTSAATKPAYISHYGIRAQRFKEKGVPETTLQG